MANPEQALVMRAAEDLVFTMPLAKAEEVTAGLEATYRSGWRYPTPFFMRHEPQFPPRMQRLIQFLHQPEDRRT